MESEKREIKRLFIKQFNAIWGKCEIRNYFSLFIGVNTHTHTHWFMPFAVQLTLFSLLLFFVALKYRGWHRLRFYPIPCKSKRAFAEKRIESTFDVITCAFGRIAIHFVHSEQCESVRIIFMLAKRSKKRRWWKWKWGK